MSKLQADHLEQTHSTLRNDRYTPNVLIIYKLYNSQRAQMCDRLIIRRKYYTKEFRPEMQLKIENFDQNNLA